MIETARVDVLDAGVGLLNEFGRGSGASGRFIVLYLGLRRMGPGLAALGSDSATPTNEIEGFMDALLTKRHRTEPLVVLTAPFGTTSPRGPYRARTGERAPGNQYPTNTWRNHLGIQKGVGCPAEPRVIETLLAQPARRLACPHLASDPDGQHLCSIEGTSYRGEEHSIWLRKVANGWQAVDLDQPAVYDDYLRPGGKRIPIFPLIAALYCDAADALPTRTVVGIADFASDFRFGIDRVGEVFDCDPASDPNKAILQLASAELVGRRAAKSTSGLTAPASRGLSGDEPASAQPLPELPGPVLLNSGLGAELAVADDLRRAGWDVLYRGAQSGKGYDLEATRDEDRLHVEVKSSVGFAVPELTESEWRAAQAHGELYVLAVVDFAGSNTEELWYVRDPAAKATPGEIAVGTALSGGPPRRSQRAR